MNIDNVKDIRSGTANENIQEVIDAASSPKHALDKGQQQYQTPEWLARGMAAMLPHGHHDDVFDPQCAGGNLLMAVTANQRRGLELDRRFIPKEEAASYGDRIQRITGNCVTVLETMDDLFPDTKFGCIVANPPFGISWASKDTTIDSTQWTWNMIKARLETHGSGFMISNAKTIERMKIQEDPWVYLYQKFPEGGIWENCNVELGVVHFQNRPNNPITRREKVWTHVPDERELIQIAQVDIPYFGYERPYNHSLRYDWGQLTEIIKEESGDHPKYNIYLGKDEMLRTYLSTRAKVKIEDDEIVKLSRINRCHPLTLTTERETRKLLHHFIHAGIYTIEPAARMAIAAALAEVASLACPIRPVTDFEHVAYLEEEDNMKCIALDQSGGPNAIALTIGKRYEVSTGTYGFKDRFSRKKIYYDEDTQRTEIDDHECELSGEDRYTEMTDDRGRIHRFMEKPVDSGYQHPESMIWKLFQKPLVLTVAEVDAPQYNRHKFAMEINEQLSGFTYFPGQKEYYARMACKDYGLVAADVGTGKSLGALTLIALKSPGRTLLIAPQGTMRSTGEEDEVDYQASQWVTEIQRFAPGEPVFQLFSEKDWHGILHANGGKLPKGIYITYPQAYFSNGGFEHLPESWGNLVEKKFCERFGLPFNKEKPADNWFSRNVGASKDNGIRCIAEPSLQSLIFANHGEAWDMVIIDEAHLCCNGDAQVTKNLMRMQPKYRFAMTATPIPNIVSNIFTLMGWLCVKDWYKGNIRNAAWPYAIDEIGRFRTTFLSTEVDLTAQQKARAKGKKSWRQVGTTFSPVISSPARLLKLLKPNLAYISKEDCNPDLKTCQVIDVRVAMGKEQAKSYAFWLERKNYQQEFKCAFTIARVQSQRLRGLCAAPASVDYNRGVCKSNFNPKHVAILQLIRDCLRKGEPVTVVSARVAQSSALASRLSEAGIPIARIDSSVAPGLHAAEANRFKKGDARVMLMGIKCAQGHSFDHCPNLIVGSLEWSYGTLHQAKGRVWRLTSPKNVTIWCVLNQNTIEEVLFDKVALKQDAATLCLHGKRVPRDFKTMDASEVLADHIVNYDAGQGEILSESECESQWPDLLKQLVVANVNKRGVIVPLPKKKRVA